MSTREVIPHAQVDLRTFAVSGPMLPEHRDLLVRIVAPLIEAGDRAAANPDVAPPGFERAG